MSELPTYCPLCAEREPHTCESAPKAPDAVPTTQEHTPALRHDGPAGDE